jgi:hypothetical protein
VEWGGATSLAGEGKDDVEGDESGCMLDTRGGADARGDRARLPLSSSSSLVVVATRRDE